MLFQTEKKAVVFRLYLSNKKIKSKIRNLQKKLKSNQSIKMESLWPQSVYPCKNGHLPFCGFTARCV